MNDATLAVNSFVSLHPNYPVSSENREKIEKYLTDAKLPTTYNNIEAAYFALVEKGEIQSKSNTVRGKVLKSIDLCRCPSTSFARKTATDKKQTFSIPQVIGCRLLS